MEKVWIVTKFVPGHSREPVVCAFDNAEAAEKYARHIEADPQPSYYCIDRGQVYSDFKIIDPKKEETED